MDSTSSSLGMTLGLGSALVVFLLVIAALGLLTGALARFLLPGPDPMSLPATAGFGVGGALLGGLIGRLAHLGAVPNYVLSVGGAMLLIWFFGRRGAGPAA
jgi:uncharacterized membrane protein YeaQ/YmgE (transglycosylase-associated protein family)